MTSQIVRTNPTAGTATTSSVRNNFGYAADEINVLQRSGVEYKNTTGSSAAYNVNYGGSPQFALVDGVRVSARIHVESAASPVLTVSPGPSPHPIVKNDGSSLVAGDLALNGVYEFMYNAVDQAWMVLGVAAITSEITLLTKILGGLYPVGSLLTTTNSASPGDADYFFSGITFGTWEAYAQGRTIIGIDQGSAIISGSSVIDTGIHITTVTIPESAILLGDSITVSGFTGNALLANGTFSVRTVSTAAGVTTITYLSPGLIALPTFPGDGFLQDDRFKVSQEVGGEIAHELTFDELAVDASVIFAGGQGQFASTAESVAGDAHNNLQPYIVTYIWKRIVTPTP